jgi:hypothetical protein
VQTALADYRYAAAWRGGLWNPDTIARSAALAGGGGARGGAGAGVTRSLCNAVSAFATGDTGVALRLAGLARVQVVNGILASSTESVSSVYPAMVQLQSLIELEEAIALANFDNLSASSGAGGGAGGGGGGGGAVAADEHLHGGAWFKSVKEVEKRWTLRYETTETSWETREPLLALRAVLLRIIHKKASEHASHCRSSHGTGDGSQHGLTDVLCR